MLHKFHKQSFKRRKKIHNVLTYGSFDLLHIGHVRLLERAALCGDRLFVGLSTDEFNFMKGKKSIYSYQERYEILSSIKFITSIFPESSWEQKRDDIRKFSIRTFIMGDDWYSKFDDLGDVCKVIYLPRTPDISTTDIKYSIKQS
jgi:glycerol-3-phosphate cytidylyltransferase